MHIVHVVKRLGRVGGMESYVWHLVHGLVDRGVIISVVCEQVIESPRKAINVIEIEPFPERPRWRAMIKFRQRADEAIKTVFRGQAIVVHSHERMVGHQVTTFHGPPIAKNGVAGLFSRFSRRLTAWSKMEADELLAEGVRLILPVSSLVEAELIKCYPSLSRKSMELAWPGVDVSITETSRKSPHDSAQIRFVFVGKEWKRKGLDIAVKVVSHFRHTGQEATLTIFGPDEKDLPLSIRSTNWIVVKGWSKKVPWSEFDMIIHPARKEPFGMVIAEARAHGLLVLMSDQVGALDLGFSGTATLSIEASPRDWCDALSNLLQTQTKVREVKWTWSDLVDKHLNVVYPQVPAVKV